MILRFELVLLRGDAALTDTVVGWGVFPVCDSGVHGLLSEVLFLFSE